jgi:iron(III) transport system ATP-binding protein
VTEPGHILRIEDVSHSYDGEQVLSGVSLAVSPGETFCLLGPSGCGKSTTLRLVAGLEELQQGRIFINDQLVAEGSSGQLPPERREVGMLMQDHALFPHLSVFDNVVFGLRHLKGAARRARAMEVLKQVGMTDYADAYPHVLSGGQQQRISLARAIAPDPSLMLLDEPFSGIDARLRARIREEMLTLLHEHGTTTLIVTHDPEEAMYVADTVAMMVDGRIVQVGPPEEIYCNPVDAFVANFFSSVNRFDGVVRENVVATPFGPVPAGDLADGTAVEVLMRPEALHIGPVGGAMPPGDLGAADGRVIKARILRRAVYMHLCMGDFDGRHIHFHCRAPGHHMPRKDEPVSVSLSPDQTFVFPAPGGA